MLKVISDDCSALNSIIIFDNSIENYYKERIDKTMKEMQEFWKGHKRIILIRHDQNIGLSKAYNESVKIAVNMGFQFVLILDQDSLITSDSLRIIVRDYNTLLKKGVLVGAISMNNVNNFYTPISFLFNGKFKWKGFYYSNNVQEKRNLINSGMLIPIENFNMINGYDESFFLDNSDLEFTLRLRSKNMRLFESCSAKISVNYKETQHDYLIASLPFRKPEREYFVKDLVRCLPVAYKVSKIDMLLVVLLIISKLFGILIIKNNRKKRFTFILSGIKEGIRSILKRNAIVP